MSITNNDINNYYLTNWNNGNILNSLTINDNSTIT